MPISCARVSTRKQRNSLNGQHEKNTRYAQLLNRYITSQVEYIGSGEEILFSSLIDLGPDLVIFTAVDRFGRNKNEGVFWARTLTLHGHELHFIEDNLVLNQLSSNAVWRRFSAYLDHAAFELNRIRYRSNRIRQ